MKLQNFKFKKNDYGVYIPDIKFAIDAGTNERQKDVISTIRANTFSYIPTYGNLIRGSDGCQGNEYYYTSENYKIISFDDWLELKKVILAANEIHKKFRVGDLVKGIVYSELCTISSMDISFGNNNNIFTSVAEQNDGICLWKDGVFATRAETVQDDTVSFKVGDLVYLEKQYIAPEEAKNYAKHLKLNTPYEVKYVGMNPIGGSPQLCIKLEEDPEMFYQAACKFKLWDKKPVMNKPKDDFDFDAALKAAKKVWPDFEWGCTMNCKGGTFKAIIPEEFGEYMKKVWFEFLDGRNSTYIIDPKNTYTKNYHPKDLKVVVTKPSKPSESAKERADKLMSCLPGNITKEKPVKKADISNKELPGFDTKIVSASNTYPNGHTSPDCKNYKIGDYVYYLGELCQIAAFTKDYYIVTYSNGWTTNDGWEMSILKGSLKSNGLYNVCTDYDLSPLTKQSKSGRYTFSPSGHSEFILPLKEESSIITTSLSEPLVLNLKKKQIKTITV